MKATKMYLVSVYTAFNNPDKVQCGLKPFTSNDNVKCILGSAICASVFASRKEAENVLQFWIDSYTKQGRYASIFE